MDSNLRLPVRPSTQTKRFIEDDLYADNESRQLNSKKREDVAKVQANNAAVMSFYVYQKQMGG